MTATHASALKRVEISFARLMTEIRARAIAISADGRIGERDAASLLGYNQGWFRQMRGEGSGPPFYRLGVAGAKVSYRVDDLAMWVESRADRASLQTAGKRS